MNIFTFDGSEKGLLTCIFESYAKKNIPDRLYDDGVQCSLVDLITEIKTDEEKADRVYKCLLKAKTPYAFHDAKITLRSGEEDKYSVAFNYLKFVIDNKDIDVSKNYAYSCVLDFYDRIKKIFNEVHRFKGMIRFSETVNNFFYAQYSPDNDITELLMPHFKARYKNQAFIIHDVKRNVLGLYDGKVSKTVNGGNNKVTIYFSEEEKNFRELWKTYYKSVNIKERAKEDKTARFMPKKYWKNLPEKYQ